MYLSICTFSSGNRFARVKTNTWKMSVVHSWCESGNPMKGRKKKSLHSNLLSLKTRDVHFNDVFVPGVSRQTVVYSWIQCFTLIYEVYGKKNKTVDFTPVDSVTLLEDLATF